MDVTSSNRKGFQETKPEKEQIAKLKISEWAEEDRPREKLMLKGRESLSDAELMAILIGSGTVSLSAVEVSQLILNSCSNNLNELAKFSVKELMKFKGIGEAKAITIVSALELGRRRKAADFMKKEKINSSKDAYECMKAHLLDLNHEEFWLILLNRANVVIKKVEVSKGGVSGTVVDPKIVFGKALEHQASGLILVHNHPSGNLKPSTNDIELTKKLKNGGSMLDISVLDHLIFADNGYYSFADEADFF